MPLNDITFVRGQGGLGRPLTGEDHVSSLLIYNDALPSGFSATDRIKAVYSLEQAEALGIVGDFSDETASTGTVEITNVGTNGNTIAIKVAEPNATVTLCTYTKVAGDTTVTNVADAIEALINADTDVHGYSATNLAGVITITARAGLGVFLDSGTPITTVISGTIAATITQFSGGVASELAPMHYHISEYFRTQPKGILYVGIYEYPTTYTFEEVATLVNYSGGKIRQMGVYVTDTAYASGQVTTLQTICNTLAGEQQPLSILYAADMSAVSDLSTLADLRTLSAPNVSVVIGQDGAAEGKELYDACGYSITCLGAALGAVSFSKVSESIAWVGKFNMSNGVELDVAAFANGDLYRDTPKNLVSQLNTNKYIFLRKYINNSGTYFNDSHTATPDTSDYAYIENQRTIDKAVRGIYAQLQPEIASPLVLNADGTLQDVTVAYFENKAEVNLQQMVRDGELSAFSVVIDPSQNVLSTSKLVVTVQLLPIGVARQIQVNIGFTLSI